jgi:hypothetical protein
MLLLRCYVLTYATPLIENGVVGSDSSPDFAKIIIHEKSPVTSDSFLLILFIFFAKAYQHCTFTCTLYHILSYVFQMFVSDDVPSSFRHILPNPQNQHTRLFHVFYRPHHTRIAYVVSLHHRFCRIHSRTSSLIHLSFVHVAIFSPWGESI